MIISVPIAWNLRHKSSFSNVTLTFGSGLEAAVLLLVGPPPPKSGGFMGSIPKWGPKGNPVIKEVEISMATIIWSAISHFLDDYDTFQNEDLIGIGR